MPWKWQCWLYSICCEGLLYDAAHHVLGDVTATPAARGLRSRCQLQCRAVRGGQSPSSGCLQLLVQAVHAPVPSIAARPAQAGIFLTSLAPFSQRHGPDAALSAANNPSLSLTSNYSQWMMIPQSLASLDGTACNLVGTSYTAFLNQPVSCPSRSGR